MENNKKVRKPNNIILNMKFWDFNFVKNAKIEKKNKFRISQAHRENVNKLPDQKYNFEIYAKSDSL